MGSHEVITSFITGGKIAGLHSFQHTGLEAAERGLDRLALAISSTLNAQNKLGMDLNGNLGGNIFNDMNTGDLAAKRSIPSPANTGSGSF
jgi:flagellar hook-associated protein 1 FlgK